MAAVAENGALYTWGGYSAHAHRHSPTLGHAPNEVRLQESLGGTPSLATPTAVAALAHVQVGQAAAGPSTAKRKPAMLLLNRQCCSVVAGGAGRLRARQGGGQGRLRVLRDARGLLRGRLDSFRPLRVVFGASGGLQGVS